LKGTRFSRGFYARHPLIVAKDLLGQRLVRVCSPQSPGEASSEKAGAYSFNENVRRLTGYIVEVEAYAGVDDAASHACGGLTRRNAPMFGPPGHAYIYFIYGMHWMFNPVAHQDPPGAVLIRALVPDEGIEVMRTYRACHSDRLLTNGPARLAQALAIDGSLNSVDLCSHPELYIESGVSVPDEEIATGPRVGVRGDESARTRPWRLWIKDTDRLLDRERGYFQVTIP
jgi:DNA-3-methyladenine glycosylase